ncbi:hypothetical protein AYL99_11854 [Fonsecaea erecta]|uniref:Uncharacterized protein n=1 Tax=Fonsecaea erecta TaxID=1367422 RepID=A0A178Z2P7_9EURO|nr:hypothetical protein AYL99_11854 [Fonsecaea erecta]OAP53974.1 hypothetical protein AYL99_11854 [Fonsecaea erecta]
MDSPPDTPSPPPGLPPTGEDQFRHLLTFAQDVAANRMTLKPDHLPLTFDIHRESWVKLWSEEEGIFLTCVEARWFRYFYDSSRSLLTILPPLSYRHQAICTLLMRLAYDAKSKLASTFENETSIMRGEGILEDKMSIMCSSGAQMSTGVYAESEKQPDILIQWHKSVIGVHAHTIVEIGLSQSLDDLQDLARFWLNGDTHIQRVVLIDIIETPKFDLHTKASQIENLPCFKDPTQKFQRDESTGAISFAGFTAVGESMIIWEAWERDATGVPQSTFHEAFSFGEIPSKDLPFFTIARNVYGDRTTWRGMDTSVTPELIQKFWREEWVRASWTDACERMHPFVGVQRANEIWWEARARDFAPLPTEPTASGSVHSAGG